MKRNLPLLLTGIIALGGCATVTPPAAEQAAPTAAPATEATAPAAPAAVAPAVPPVEMDSALLYELLVGEVSAQRGELEMSAHAYLQAASTTRDPRLARRATQIAVYGHDYTTALKAARLWVEFTPEDIEAQQSLAALLVKQGYTDEALNHLKQLLTLAKGGMAQGFGLVTNILARESQKARALQVMQALVTPLGDDPNAVFAYADLAFLVEEFPLAEQQVDRLLVLQPGSQKAMVLKANILRRLGKNDEALAVYRQAVDAAPKDSSLRLGYARMLVDAERLPQAREQFHILGKQLPDNADVAYAEGLLAMQANDLVQAEKYFQRLLKLGQREDEAAFALGQIAEARGNTDDALNWYEQVSGGNNYMDAMIRAAVLINGKQGLAAARDYLHQVEPQTSEQALRLRLAEGEMLRDANQLQEAAAVYDSALQEFPDNPDLLYARAMNAERMDRIDLLERDLRAILKRDPNNVQALNALGYTLADRTDRYKEAFDLINKAYKLRSDDAAIIDSMGWVSYRLGQMETAEKYLRAALTKQYDAEIAAHLGEVLWQEGKKEEGQRVWQEALKRFPDSPELKQAIERFKQ